ncbi:MAG: biotin carboxylase-like protein [uncultured bacterium]|nr:MAG: biotin carboxylase-like protein [uncultured bacterium]
MKKHVIKDLESLKAYCKKIKNPIIGVGARTYNLTIGIHNIFNHFEILACKGGAKETHLIENKFKVTYLDNLKKDELKNLDNHKTYCANKPQDLFKNKAILKYFASFKSKPIFLFFKTSPEIEKVLKEKRYISVNSDLRMHNKYENKINFQNLIDYLKIPSPEHATINANELDYNRITSLVGKKFVIQKPESELGSGTFFILEEKDFSTTIKKPAIQDAIRKNIDLKITRFINRDCAPSITVLVSRFGVLYTGLQKQIIDAEEVTEKSRRSGVYCGHDWTSSRFDPKIQKQACEIAEKIGRYFQEKENFRGIFGIDFVLEKETNNLYPIEANVRLLGSFPLISMIQENAGQPIIQALQILEKLNRNDYELDIKSLNNLMAQNKPGAHLNIHSKNKKTSYVSGNIRPGIYKVDIANQKVTYSREGVFFSDLNEKNEILLTYGVPHKNRVFELHKCMCKLITRGSFLNNNDKLNKFAKIMTNYVYKKLALKPIE